MTPDERQLLSGLFDRIRGAANASRDREAESFIGDAVKAQPYAPYLLAQTVIVQDQALRAANDKLQELEQKVSSLEAGRSGGGDTSFLGGIGRSIFGQSQNEPPRSPPSSAGNYPQQGYGQQGYAQAQTPGGFGQGGGQQGGPWGQAGGGQGGGFLKGALGAAAGVAGGVLLANSISGLFHGNNGLGIASGMPGMGGGFGAGGLGGETIVNNYYEGEPGGGAGTDGGGYDNAADFGADDGSFGSDDGGLGSDDGYNV